MQPEEKKVSAAEKDLIEDFIQELNQTAKQVQALLDEIRESKVCAAVIQADLKHLVENVRSLSAIIREGGNSGSVLTRLALLEQSVKDIKEYVSKDSDAGSQVNIKVALLEQKVDVLVSKKEFVTQKKPTESDGKWKLYITIAGGVFTLLGSLAAALL